MKVRMLIAVFQVFALYSIAITANAGSSATAITTISANIVPAASFSVTQPVLLNQQAASNLPGPTIQGENTEFSNSVILRTTNTNNTAKFRVKSSQNLAYDVSMSPHVSVFDFKTRITANINHTLDVQGQLDITEEHVLDIGGVLMDPSDQNSGAYHGLIDITVNYN